MTSFFNQLTSFLEKEIIPIANELDEDTALFAKVYPRFVKLGGLNLLVPQELGGLGGGREEWIEYNILMSQYSGALLFLQAQHQFCISRLKNLLPNQKIENFLRSFVQEERGMGLALEKNKNLLKVEATSTGYRLSGTFRWCTGHNYFSHLLISFEHQEILFYTFLPFHESVSATGSLHIGPRIETAVFNAVPSNSVTLENYFISHQEILASHATRPMPLVEHPTSYNFAGVAKALLKIALQGKFGTNLKAQEKHNLLTQEWKHYYESLKRGSNDPYRLRREGLQLVEKCILLARVACGSSGILRSHPLGRLIRESWQYTVAGYSEQQVEAYWELFRNSESNELKLKEA
ncbi:MAG: acyl-CoA dehydrogenase family protein [Chthoniobacterales bacterium]|nr:acyl-CoA dehydrogenase family protein [Chthoniobacterales bacterium]